LESSMPTRVEIFCLVGNALTPTLQRNTLILLGALRFHSFLQFRPWGCKEGGSVFIVLYAALTEN